MFPGQTAHWWRFGNQIKIETACLSTHGGKRFLMCQSTFNKERPQVGRRHLFRIVWIHHSFDVWIGEPYLLRYTKALSGGAPMVSCNFRNFQVVAAQWMESGCGRPQHRHQHRPGDCHPRSAILISFWLQNPRPPQQAPLYTGPDTASSIPASPAYLITEHTPLAYLITEHSAATTSSALHQPRHSQLHTTTTGVPRIQQSNLVPYKIQGNIYFMK